DPYVGHGRHFGQTIHALCRVRAIINNGLVIHEKVDLDGRALQTLLADPSTARQYAIFEQLMKITPNFREIIFTASEEELTRIADLLQKGANGARSDDTKSLKGAVIEWITPKGQPLNPPLMRNVKIDRGIKQKLQRGELLVSGDEWPVFVYHGYTYDPEDPWNGAFHSQLLVKVYKFMFTSPSSVDKDPKATRSGNARLHDMTSVTPASIAYIATQIDGRIPAAVLETFMDPDDADEVAKLIDWWNRQVFPGHLLTSERIINKDSALARIKERHAQRKALREAGNSRGP
ncbi:hypothetical protein DXG01_008119, partial [Tephrocybe rancida]